MKNSGELSTEGLTEYILIYKGLKRSSFVNCLPSLRNKSVTSFTERLEQIECASNETLSATVNCRF